jgi:hypothetical protein
MQCATKLDQVLDTTIDDYRVLSAAMPFTAEQKTIFDEAYEKAKKLDAGDKLVQLMYLLLDLIMKSGQGVEMKIPPKHMGIHPANRSGKKMVGAVMQKKGNKITNVGFTLKLCGPDRAIAFEVSPTSNTIEQHTLAITSSPNFANYVPGTIRAGSVGCGHLNQFLAAVADGAETSYANLSLPDEGRLSKTIITKGNKECEDAVDNGLTWFVIKFQIEELYPLLPSIIQRAINVEHHVGEGLLPN